MQVVIKDSIVLKDTTIYKTDTAYLPGDSVEMWQAIPCPNAKLDTVISKGHTTLTATISKGFLQFKCNSDSLLHIIDSITRLKQKESYHTEKTTVEVPVQVIKYKVPKWCWMLLAFNVAAVGWKFRFKILNLLGA